MVRQARFQFKQITANFLASISRPYRSESANKHLPLTTKYQWLVAPVSVCLDWPRRMKFSRWRVFSFFFIDTTMKNRATHRANSRQVTRNIFPGALITIFPPLLALSALHPNDRQQHARLSAEDQKIGHCYLIIYCFLPFWKFKRTTFVLSHHNLSLATIITQNHVTQDWIAACSYQNKKLLSFYDQNKNTRP